MSDDTVFEVSNFKNNSYIIIEDQEDSGEFFIIKKGKVIENRSASELELESGTLLTVGDFFGVISCMTKRPRIETVQAVEDTTTINVKREHLARLSRRTHR